VAPRTSAAVHDLVQLKSREERLGRVHGSWEVTVAAMRGFEGVSVLSHEFLGLAPPAVVRRVAESFAGSRVRVVVTVRDAAATLPAQWQTFARNRGTALWPEYAAAARDPRTRPREHTFLRSQRIGRTLRLWRDLVEPDELHVVSVPASGGRPDLLWERFASILGVDPATARSRDVAANSSTGYATAHLLCLLHQEGARVGLPKAHVRHLTRLVAEAAATRRSVEGPPPLDEAALRFAGEWNRRVLADVSEVGAMLTGAAADLPVEPALHRASVMALPTDPQFMEAARAAAASLSRADGAGPVLRASSPRCAVRELVTRMAAVRG
jgi:hypothetical protein